jgi:serine/threonine protein kinase
VLKEAFLKEMMTLMKLRGTRHLAEILSFGFCEEQRRWFLVMAFVEGMSLQTYMDLHGLMPPVEAVACFRAVAEALGQAHALGIIHRDIKPANLLRAADGTLTLVDFGLAGAANARGTLDFAAPEQLRGRPADARSDVYSLAATLYFVLTREHPDRFRRERIPDKQLAELLARSLATNPEARPANATVLAGMLRDVAQSGAAQKGAPAIAAAPAGLPLPAPAPRETITEKRKIIVYGQGDKTEKGFPTATHLEQYIKEDIFHKYQGRFQYTQSKEADDIVLARDGLAHGRFEVEDRVSPNDKDREEYPPVKSVYIIRRSALYERPVKLSDLGIRNYQFGKRISEEDLAKIEKRAGNIEYFQP